MRRGRTLILLALILLVGALAAFLILTRLDFGGGPQVPEGTPVPFTDTRNIVIAAQDIARGAEIPPDGVILSPFPADYFIETMIDSTDLVVGRRARMNIPRGVPITQGMITRIPDASAGTGSDASFAIEPGKTAISIPMDRLSGVAFALRPGDNVDVLVSLLVIDVDPEFQTALPNETGMLVGPDGLLLGAVGGRKLEVERDEFGGVKITVADDTAPPLGRLDSEEETGQPFYVLPGETQRPRLVTQRLIANAIVLHVGTFPLEGEGEVTAAPQQQPLGAEQQPEAGAQQPQAPQIVAPDIITLVVTPQDALTLNWAIKAGLDLTLTLRAPGDTTQAETSSVTLQFIVDNYSITIPGKPAFGLVPRLDEPIRPQLPNDPQQETPQQ